ncbi:5'-3' exonuclease PLD4 isoform X3 [Camelus bactrianus]|uniref:5'-3' exonuclease PLD4 isoform X3 n=1 Tax=Camelus bactrianus TaxID=9837 RepID=A0A9W3FJT9_CAMBA
MSTRAGPPELQVLGLLAMLGLGTVTLTYLLWQLPLLSTGGRAHPQGGPAGSWGLGSSLAWEPLGGEPQQQPQKDSCRLILVESIPQDLPSLTGSPSAQPLAQAWLQLLDAAQESIHVASFYWSLTGPDIGVNDSSSQLGEALLQKLEQLLDRNVSLAVATSSPTLARKSTDLQVLAARGAQVRRVPLGRLTGGVLHSKFWVVDGRHVYVGSANMDWRSLTQVKELGTIIYNCSRLAQDLEKTFQTYWVLGAPEAVLPKPWPRNFSSHINHFQPLRDHFDGVPTTAYFSVLAGAGHSAAGGGHRQACAGAPAGQLLAQHGPQHVPLPAVPAGPPQPRGQRLRGRVFIVPVGNHSNIPFSRVNHSKFMVTEKTAYIGTSNWSEDYFSSTSGVGLVVTQRASGAQPGVTTVQKQLRQLFERDWSSPYAVGLDGQAQGQDCVWQG